MEKPPYMLMMTRKQQTNSTTLPIEPAQGAVQYRAKPSTMNAK